MVSILLPSILIRGYCHRLFNILLWKALDIHLPPLLFGIFFKDDHGSQPKQEEADNCVNAKKTVDHSKVSSASEVGAAVKTAKQHMVSPESCIL